MLANGIPYKSKERKRNENAKTVKTILTFRFSTPYVIQNLKFMLICLTSFKLFLPNSTNFIFILQ